MSKGFEYGPACVFLGVVTTCKCGGRQKQGHLKDGHIVFLTISLPWFLVLQSLCRDPRATLRMDISFVIVVILTFLLRTHVLCLQDTYGQSSYELGPSFLSQDCFLGTTPDLYDCRVNNGVLTIEHVAYVGPL